MLQQLGIEPIEDGLWVTQYQLPSGETVYMAIEQVDDQTQDFWLSYASRAKRVLDTFYKGFAQDIRKERAPQYPEGYSKYFESKEAYENAIQTIKKYDTPPQKFYKLAENIAGGFAGLDQLVWNINGEVKCERYVGYISKTPITTKHQPWRQDGRTMIKHGLSEAAPEDMYQDLHDHTNNILMSVGFTENDDTPTTTHYGIARNPLSFFDGKNEYKNLSMPLHGFLATFAKTRNPDKKWMINSPLRSMVDILKRDPRIEDGDIHIGTVEDLKRAKENNSNLLELFEQHPPILTSHNDILKEGLTADQLMRQNVSELIETKSSGQRINTSGLSMSFPQVAVKLDALIRCYEPNLDQKLSRDATIQPQPSSSKEPSAPSEVASNKTHRPKVVFSPSRSAPTKAVPTIEPARSRWGSSSGILRAAVKQGIQQAANSTVSVKAKGGDLEQDYKFTLKQIHNELSNMSSTFWKAMPLDLASLEQTDDLSTLEGKLVAMAMAYKIMQSLSGDGWKKASSNVSPYVKEAIEISVRHGDPKWVQAVLESLCYQSVAYNQEDLVRWCIELAKSQGKDAIVQHMREANYEDVFPADMETELQSPAQNKAEPPTEPLSKPESQAISQAPTTKHKPVLATPVRNRMQGDKPAESEHQTKPTTITSSAADQASASFTGQGEAAPAEASQGTASPAGPQSDHQHLVTLEHHSFTYGQMKLMNVVLGALAKEPLAAKAANTLTLKLKNNIPNNPAMHAAVDWLVQEASNPDANRRKAVYDQIEKSKPNWTEAQSSRPKR